MWASPARVMGRTESGIYRHPCIHEHTKGFARTSWVAKQPRELPDGEKDVAAAVLRGSQQVGLVRTLSSSSSGGGPFSSHGTAHGTELDSTLML